MGKATALVRANISIIRRITVENDDIVDKDSASDVISDQVRAEIEDDIVRVVNALPEWSVDSIDDIELEDLEASEQEEDEEEDNE